ncbi:glucokinase [Luteimonas lutimaris]|uniref:Glucokinase n=1 Tax=Luteimonas lutimaris TaxID=698645 RepID=A0ABP7MF50_9GAMM
MNNTGPDVLLADIGGTNARFALAHTSTRPPLLDGSVEEYAVAEFPSLGDAARHYLDSQGAGSHVRDGVFAVAGRVEGGHARITNHPWTIDAPRIEAMLGFERVRLVNDFAAQSMAIPALQPGDLATLGGVQWAPDTTQRDRSYAVIGPGTGLGVGVLLVRDGRPWPLETEGGHASFPPGTPEEIAILQQLSEQFGRVSNERLVSGPGLVNIHRALSAIAGVDPGPMRPEDVTTGAAAGDARCMRAVDVFCAVFGAIAGDLVLTTGAWDGVFLTGGLVPRMLDALRHSGFRQRFENKGRFSPNLARVPSTAILHPQPGLLGCAVIAQQAGAAA